DQAKKMNMDMIAYQKLKTVKDKAETIYYQAGGQKEILRKGILEGKGNQDRKVPLSMLNGLGCGPVEWGEKQISNAADGHLGEVVTAAAIAAATAAVTALAGAIKQIGSLFKKGSPESAAYDDGSGITASASSAPHFQPSPLIPHVPPQKQNYTLPATYAPAPNPVVRPPAPTDPYANTGMDAGGGLYPLPANQGNAVVPFTQETETGFFGKAKEWAKNHPSFLLIGALAATTGYALYRSNKKEKGLGGISRSTAKSRSGKKRKRVQTRSGKKVKIKAMKL
nr:alanine and proline-rich secreted protein Apa [Bacteroidota bacterium]